MAVPGWHMNLGTRHADLSSTGDFAFPSLGLEQRRLPYFKQAALLFPRPADRVHLCQRSDCAAITEVLPVRALKQHRKRKRRPRGSAA